MEAPTASESSKALAAYTSQLDAAEKDYKKAHNAFSAIRNRSNINMDWKAFDDLAHEQHTQIGRSLKTVCSTVQSASLPGQLSSGDLDRLVERAAMIESEIIELSFAHKDDEGTTEIACSDVLKEESGASPLASSIGMWHRSADRRMNY